MSDPPNPSFDLLGEPWIPVILLSGDLQELSIREVLLRAPEIRAITGDLPTTVFALHRLLLAILYRALPTEDPRSDWQELWAGGSLPDGVQRYLDEYADRFDLLHPERPFGQVADLRTAGDGVSGLEKLVADVPNGEQYFTTRAGAGLASLSFAEAARWVVHAQAFDPSGIKSGALGDDRVKGGKGYPIGTAWAGSLGGLLIEGDNLRETLVLNLCLGSQGRYNQPWSEGDDRPVWEREPLGAAEEDPGAMTGPFDGRPPTGPADVLSWPSRRIRLVHDGTRVTGVILANGDKLGPQDRFSSEPMTGWRRSDPQAKKYGLPVVWMPREHDPSRSLWRGIGALLPHAAGIGTADRDRFRPAATLEWIRGMVGDSLDENYLIRTRAIGMVYGSQSAVVEDVVDDSLVMHAALLDSAELQTFALDAVQAADAAVAALGDLAKNLAVAAGGTGEGQRLRAREAGFDALDGVFRGWLRSLVVGARRDQVMSDWYGSARVKIQDLADRLISSAGPAAWSGREQGSTRINVGSADRWYRTALNRALPRPERVSAGPERVRAS